MVCCEKRGNAASHTCACTTSGAFAANGDLQGVPFRRGQKGMVGMPKDFKPEEHHLHKLRVDSYKGLLFATFSDQTPPLPDYLGEQMRPGSTASSTSPSSTWAARDSTPSRTGSCTLRT